MKSAIVAALGASLVVASLCLVSPPPAAADTNYWTGYVVHVSTTNIKVADKARMHTLSFLVVPHFKRVFSDDGKTTYQMAQIKPGMLVKVVYDQDLLGARHADKIYILNTEGEALKAQGS